jgi:hypothetical protein
MHLGLAGPHARDVAFSLSMLKRSGTWCLVVFHRAENRPVGLDGEGSPGQGAEHTGHEKDFRATAAPWRTDTPIGSSRSSPTAGQDPRRLHRAWLQRADSRVDMAIQYKKRNAPRHDDAARFPSVSLFQQDDRRGRMMER